MTCRTYITLNFVILQTDCSPRGRLVDICCKFAYRTAPVEIINIKLYDSLIVS